MVRASCEPCAERQARRAPCRGTPWRAQDVATTVCHRAAEPQPRPVEQAVLLATPAVLPADSVGETAADMAGLAACSTTSS